MAKNFHLTIAKVGENLFDAEAEYVTLPGQEGEFTVLAHHEPFVSELKAGSVKIKDADGKLHMLAVSTTGIAEVSHNQATVLL
jgi:F-type H+-transporting ATPase subunit epsilon